ncbi:MAG: hypothetical protein H0X24_09290 [Ktedonobacterales bacterium]|nr:hypothetical protein [Ktedonobacterales bacterium]
MLTNRHPRFHAPFSSFALIGLLGLLLTACGAAQQMDPSGMNSGSPQFAEGTFNFSTTASDVTTGVIGQTLTVYDSFTTVNTNFTVASAQFTMAPANLNTDTQTLDANERYLVVTLKMRNASVTAQGCANHKPSECIEYLSPLSNIRLVDAQKRVWPPTTGALETCSNDPHTMCSQRAWLDIAANGIAPTKTVTARLAFVVPVQGNFTLYFAPYRYSDASSASAGGTSSGQDYPTVAAVNLNI